jgi:Tfp pilus assembly protein PilF
VQQWPVAAAARDTGTSAPSRRASEGSPGRAKEAIEAGMEAFGKGDSQTALELFQAALSLRPNQVRFSITHWIVKEYDAIVRAATQQCPPRFT